MHEVSFIKELEYLSRDLGISGDLYGDAYFVSDLLNVLLGQATLLPRFAFLEI